MTKLQEKMYYTTYGFLLTGANALVLGTRFNLIGVGFGIAACYMFIRSLLIKIDKHE